MTPGGSSAETLARKVSGLVSRHSALSAERKTQAKGYKAEASYLYGAAAAFEVVATELWEALGKHGAVPPVALAPYLSVLAERREEASSSSGDGLLPLVDLAEAAVGHLVDDRAASLEDQPGKCGR